jgi:hypothetical protein
MGFIHGGGHHGNGNGHGHAHPHLDLGHGHGHGGHALGHGHGAGGHAGHGGGHVAHGGHTAHGGHIDAAHGAHPNAPGSQQSPLTAPKVGAHSGLVKLSKFGKFKSIFAISPIDIFALALGGGATGIVARNSVDPAILPWVAAAGAVILNYGIVRPMFMLAMKFVGVPSEGLSGAIARTGEAMTKFDQQGRGLVHLVLDGEEKQVLANLDQSDRDLGVQVLKGDQLLILDVDEVRNTCRVTRV